MKNLNKIRTAKFVARNVVATSVSFCVASVIQQNVAIDKPADKAKLAIGSMALGAMVADKSREYVDNTIDAIVQQWNEIKEKDALKTND